MVKNSNSDLGLAATTKEEVFLFGRAQAAEGQAEEARADPSDR